MISRTWHGYTTRENADEYEALLKEDVFLSINQRHIPGFKEVQLFRRQLEDEVEFITVMWFDTLDAVRLFAGDDYALAVVPPKARLLLKRFDGRVQHYEVRDRLFSNIR